MRPDVTDLVLVLIFLVLCVIAGVENDKKNAQIADLTAELCVATEGTDFFMCHAKCQELPGNWDRPCLDKFKELVNARPNETRSEFP